MYSDIIGTWDFNSLERFSSQASFLQCLFFEKKKKQKYWSALQKQKRLIKQLIQYCWEKNEMKSEIRDDNLLTVGNPKNTHIFLLQIRNQLQFLFYTLNDIDFFEATVLTRK